MINGDGTAALNGSAPRMYVYYPTLQQKWDNVKITIYAKRVSEQAKVSSQGITAGARSGSHDDVKYPNVCTDSTGYPNTVYNGRLTCDGRADSVNEIDYKNFSIGEINSLPWDYESNLYSSYNFYARTCSFFINNLQFILSPIQTMSTWNMIMSTSSITEMIFDHKFLPSLIINGCR